MSNMDPFRVALRERDFRLLLASLASSTAGDWFYSVALAVFVFERTHSAAWVAAATIGRLAPYVIFGLIAGQIADRADRRRLMLRADLARAFLMAILAVVASFDGSPALALGVAFACATAGTPYVPAVTALTPTLVPERSLAAANSLAGSVNYLALVLGPALGTVMLVLTSPATAFAVNAGCFALSAFAVHRMQSRPLRRTTSPAGSSTVRRMLQGIASLVRSGETAVLAGFSAGQAFLYGLETVLLVLASQQLLGMGAVGYGWLLTSIGAGGLIAALFIGRLSELRHPTILLVASVFAVGLPIASLAIIRQPAVAYVLLAFDGAGTLLTEVLAITALQRSLREYEIGKVFAAMDALAFGAVLLGSFVAPILVELVGLRTALVIGGASAPVITIMISPLLRNVDRRARERIRALAPTVEILARSPIFIGAMRSSLEMLAAMLTGVRVAAGDVVVRRGDIARDFYVVVDGELEVQAGEKDGPVLARLGPGDHFGEIGILEDCRRMATVHAVTDCKLFRIRAEDFLGVINKSPSVRGAMREGAAGRLGARDLTIDLTAVEEPAPTVAAHARRGTK